MANGSWKLIDSANLMPNNTLSMLKLNKSTTYVIRGHCPPETRCLQSEPDIELHFQAKGSAAAKDAELANQPETEHGLQYHGARGGVAAVAFLPPGFQVYQEPLHDMCQGADANKSDLPGSGSSLQLGALSLTLPKWWARCSMIGMLVFLPHVCHVYNAAATHL